MAKRQRCEKCGAIATRFFDGVVCCTKCASDMKKAQQIVEEVVNEVETVDNIEEESILEDVIESEDVIEEETEEADEVVGESTEEENKNSFSWFRR